MIGEREPPIPRLTETRVSASTCGLLEASEAQSCIGTVAKPTTAPSPPLRPLRNLLAATRHYVIKWLPESIFVTSPIYQPHQRQNESKL